MARNWRNILYNPERYLGLRRPVADSAPNYQEIKSSLQPKKVEEKKHTGQCFGCSHTALCQKIKGKNHTPFCFYKRLSFIIRDHEEEEKYEVYTNGNSNLPLFEPISRNRFYDHRHRHCNKWRKFEISKEFRAGKLDRQRKVIDLPLSEYYPFV